MVTGPLQGIRVIDLTIWMSGAIGSMLLGDLGADVIKIEGPTGDPVRRYVPIGPTGSADAPGGVNYAYALCNRNKRQIRLDLRDPAGRDRLYELVRDADVFITSMQAETLLALGADEESIKSVNPAIVYARAGGLGAAGPRANDRCQDMLGMAYAGLLFTASPEQDEPFAPPGATNDVLTGTMTAFGVLAALMQRQQSGHGETVHTSLLHTALWTQLIQFGTVANAPQLLLPARSRREPRSPGVNQYKCSDGRWIAVAAVTADAWARFVKALDLDVTDPETGAELSYAGVLAQASRVRERLDEHFAEQPSVPLARAPRSGGHLVHAGEHAGRRHGRRAGQRERVPEHTRRRPEDGNDAVHTGRLPASDPRGPSPGRGRRRRAGRALIIPGDV